MSGHVTPDTLEHYVIGALDATSARWVEAHAAGCEACAAALAAEARLELALFEVAAAPPSLEGRRARRARFAAAAVTGFSALAATVAWLLWVDRPPPPGGHPQVVRCTEVSSAEDCIARAQFDGVLTIGPDERLVVPRYETQGAP